MIDRSAPESLNPYYQWDMQIVTHFHGEQIELRETASLIKSEVLQRKCLQEVGLLPTELCWVICQPTFDLIT